MYGIPFLGSFFCNNATYGGCMSVEKITKVILEICNLYRSFFKFRAVDDKVLEVPKEVKRLGTKIGALSLVFLCLGLSFAFFLKITNIMIEARYILFGIMVFMLYQGEVVVRQAFEVYFTTEMERYDEIFDSELNLKGSTILGVVSGKVYKLDEERKIYALMSNESIINSIKQYLENVWKQTIQHKFDVCRLFAVFAMLAIAIYSNTLIPQVLFVPLLLNFTFFAFFSCAYVSMYRNDFNKKYKKDADEESSIVNDLVRGSLIVKNDLKMRIDRLQSVAKANKENVTKFNRKMNLSRFFITIVQLFSQYGIILFYLLSVDWSLITRATIVDLLAVLVIIERAMNYINILVKTIDEHDKQCKEVENVKADMSLILEVYHKEVERTSESKSIDKITLKPFKVSYKEESENDKPFTLTSMQSLEFEKGDVAILGGASGTGKSTFMKLLTERIRVEKSTEIPSTTRFMFYDEKLKLGSLTIFQELFCCIEKPDLEKMENILKNLHLWTEIQATCVDVWQWMQEKKFDNSLSNGQKQRLIVAKLLYWLDENIDVVVLDECTSGLDDKSEEDMADAERILEYIVGYCNKDKSRIILIATHQNVDGFKEKLGNEYKFKNLYFKREGDMNIVTFNE